MYPEYKQTIAFPEFTRILCIVQSRRGASKFVNLPNCYLAVVEKSSACQCQRASTRQRIDDGLCVVLSDCI